MTRRRPASRASGVGAVVVALAVVVGAAVGLSLGGASFDAVARAVDAVTASAEGAEQQAAAAGEAAAARSRAASTIAQASAAPSDAGARADLASAARGADLTRIAAVATLGAESEGSDGPSASWPTNPLALIDTAQAAADRRAAAERAAAAIAASDAPLTDAALPVFASVPDAAVEQERAAVHARNPVTIDFRDAASDAAARDTLDARSAEVFTSYAAAADALRASDRDDLARKAGPLLDARLAVEDFARSLAGGVLVHVDWAAEVNGFGGRGGIGGETTWAASDGGQAVILLSDSVAEQWPSETARALVAHEVGHAITAKCYEKFDWKSRAANEQWATAWAISLGYNGSGNGAALYGQPSDALIASAATCR